MMHKKLVNEGIMANTRSVSLHADKDYMDALSVLARRKNMSIGKLVRLAIDAQYSAELAAVTASFFVNSDASKHHSMLEKSGEVA